MNDESVDEACRGLKRAVKSYCSKHEQRFQGTELAKRKLLAQIDHLALHAEHIMIMLHKKQNSLKHAVEALPNCWGDCRDALDEAELKNKLHLRAILSHLLQHYLRIKDGDVLLTSGECRHVGDYPAKDLKYKTSLTKNQLRGDGYTALYKEHLRYSGFGWDEFFDPDHGVRKRLLKLLRKWSRKATNWESLLDRGAQLFESCLDAHETQQQGIKKSLDDFLERVRADLLRLINTHAGGGGTVHFSTQDKMESIEVVAGLLSLKLQRRADEFQVREEQGVLPIGWDRVKWRNQMSLPTRLKVVDAVVATRPQDKGTAPFGKRRRVIEDSSDEEEEPVFHLRETHAQNSSSHVSSSLNAIKHDLGVNGAELEIARETLQAEEGGHKLHEFNLEHEYLKDLRDEVSRARRALQRTLQQNDDPREAWDARDDLREKTMELGIALLEVDDSGSTAQYLLEAQSCFEKAINVTNEQEEAHDRIVKDSHDTTEGAWFICRNLVLLKGRAYTNLGIALLELSLAKTTSFASRSKNRTKALIRLKQAKNSVRVLQEKCIADRERGASASDIAADTINAARLEALALKSYASALWHNGNQDSAVDSFHAAASTDRKIESLLKEYIDKDVRFLKEYLHCSLECYHAATAFFDLVVSRINMLISGSSAVTAKKIEQKGKTLIDIARNAAELTKSNTSMIAKLENQYSRTFCFQHILVDEGILEISDIDAVLRDVEHRWNHREKRDGSPSKKLQRAGRQNHHGLPRSDLGSASLASGGRRAHFVVADATFPGTSRRKRSLQTHDFGYTPTGVTKEPSAITSITLMKWGDEVVLGPELPYPACKPSIPPNFPSQHL